VAVIPTSSQEDASRAIVQAKESILQGEESDDNDTASEDADVSEAETDGGDAEEISTATASAIRETPHPRNDSISSNITENMIGKKVRFGRFAANWLSRKAMGLPGLGTAELNTQEDTESVGIPMVEFKEEDPVAARSAYAANTEGPIASASDSSSPKVSELKPPTETKPIELLPKLLRYTKLIFSSSNFFFSYDYDLTRPVSSQPSAASGHLPIHKVADELVRMKSHVLYY
jgi:hypothetical protein